ncbi:sigma factor [Spirillospora albida]|uniref:sigma factor n=1 Tax=Spirillospora albida TaxID=58123 RepID=UPI000A03C145|nr:sigma factor [Spirillospora albida]
MRESEDFDAFYAGTSRKIINPAYAMAGDLAEAEDAVQEAYALAWQRWHRLGRYADPEGWVRTVAYRIEVSSRRKARNRLRAHFDTWPATPADGTSSSSMSPLRVQGRRRRSGAVHGEGRHRRGRPHSPTALSLCCGNRPLAWKPTAGKELRALRARSVPVAPAATPKAPSDWKGPLSRCTRRDSNP